MNLIPSLLLISAGFFLFCLPADDETFLISNFITLFFCLFEKVKFRLRECFFPVSKVDYRYDLILGDKAK